MPRAPLPHHYVAHAGPSPLKNATASAFSLPLVIPFSIEAAAVTFPDGGARRRHHPSGSNRREAKAARRKARPSGSFPSTGAGGCEIGLTGGGAASVESDAAREAALEWAGQRYRVEDEGIAGAPLPAAAHYQSAPASLHGVADMRPWHVSVGVRYSICSRGDGGAKTTDMKTMKMADVASFIKQATEGAKNAGASRIIGVDLNPIRFEEILVAQNL